MRARVKAKQVLRRWGLAEGRASYDVPAARQRQHHDGCICVHCQPDGVCSPEITELRERVRRRLDQRLAELRARRDLPALGPDHQQDHDHEAE